MKPKTLFAQGTSVLIALTVMFAATSCGTILYPERRGQSAGSIDVGVAVLDGIGLLFFLVPGIIAFAVDFSTGAIYLPNGFSDQGNHLPDLQDAQIVQTDPAALNRHEIEALVGAQTGQQIHLATAGTKVARASSSGDAAWHSMAETLTPRQLAAFESRVATN